MEIMNDIHVVKVVMSTSKMVVTITNINNAKKIWLGT